MISMAPLCFVSDSGIMSPIKKKRIGHQEKKLDIRFFNCYNMRHENKANQVGILKKLSLEKKKKKFLEDVHKQVC
jgi:hypothetical protein